MLLVLAEPTAQEIFKRGNDGDGISAARLDSNRRPGRGGEHHQAHDRCAVDRLRAPADPDIGLKLFDGLHELCRRACVQAFLVDDVHDPCDGPRGGRFGSRSSHFPASTRLAMVMYLRPASWAKATASGNGQSSRTFASFTSIGRLIPASTSTLGRLITEIARFEGVPPNISVRMATPSPLST